MASVTAGVWEPFGRFRGLSCAALGSTRVEKAEARGLRLCRLPKLSNPAKVEKFKTRGFKVFELYMRVTFVLVAIVMSPLVFTYLCASPLLGSQEFTWAKVVSRRRWKEGERVRRGLYHRLVGPQVKQTFAYFHGLLLNVVFFSVVLYVLAHVFHVAGLRADMSYGTALGVAFIPAAVLYVGAIAHGFVSRFLQYKDDCPLRYKVRMLWRSQEKTYDKLEDSVLNMMFREQVRDSVSISSMSRLDTLMLYGIPTALVACCCYLADLYTGDEKKAVKMRKEAKEYGGISVDPVVRLGFFRA